MSKEFIGKSAAYRGLVRTKEGAQAWFPTPGVYFTREEIESDFPSDKFDLEWPATITTEQVINVYEEYNHETETPGFN